MKAKTLTILLPILLVGVILLCFSPFQVQSDPVYESNSIGLSSTLKPEKEKINYSVYAEPALDYGYLSIAPSTSIEDSVRQQESWKSHLKSREHALFLSGIVTVAPAFLGLMASNSTHSEGLGIGLFEASMILGPSMASMYAEDYKSSVIGIGARSILSILMTSNNRGLGRGVIDLLNKKEKFPSDEQDIIADGYFYIGSAVYLSTILYNILTSLDAIEEHNKRIRQLNRFSITPRFNDKHNLQGIQAQFVFYF